MQDRTDEVFISYAREDEDIARALKDRLRERNIHCYMDTSDIRVGDNWRKNTRDALDRAAAIVVICTENAIESQEVAFEWAYGTGLGVTVIPVVYRPDLNLPAGLDILDHLNFVDPANRQWDRLFGRVIEAVADNAATIGTIRQFGIANIFSGRSQLLEKYTISQILARTVESSELLVIGRSLEGWAREFQELRTTCVRKSLRIRMGLVDPDLDKASWMIPNDYSMIDLSAAIEKFRLMEPFDSSCDGSFELYYLPSSPLFAFTCFEDPDGLCAVLEIGANLRFDDRQALVLRSAPSESTSLLGALRKVYEPILSQREPVFRLTSSKP